VNLIQVPSGVAHVRNARADVRGVAGDVAVAAVAAVAAAHVSDARADVCSVAEDAAVAADCAVAGNGAAAGQIPQKSAR